MKYLTNQRHRVPRFMEHNQIDQVRRTIGIAGKKRADLEIFIKTPNGYERIQRHLWDETFKETAS